MMPIIQAHADENNTVVTILNKFQDMMYHLSQKDVVINLSIAEQKNYNAQILINTTML